MEVSENLAKCFATASCEVAQVLVSTAAAENSLDAASFKAAAISIHKTQQSKAHQVVCAATQGPTEGVLAFVIVGPIRL